MKKKIIIILTVIVCGLFAATGVIACSSTEVGVGIFVDDTTDGYRGPVSSRIESILNNDGINNTKYNASKNQTTQNDQVNNAINNGLKGIIISMPDTTLAIQMLNMAASAKVPLVMFSSEPGELRDLETYSNAYLVSSRSKDAGVINAIILERELFGITEEGLTSKDIDTDWVETNYEKGLLFNNVSQYAHDTTDGVDTIKTLLVEGDISNTGSTDRTRTAMLSVNLFYEAISKAAQESEDQTVRDSFPLVESQPVSRLTLSGAGLASQFSVKEDGEPEFYETSRTGILKYDDTRSSNDGGGAAWSDSGAEESVKAYIGSSGSKAPDLIIGASDQVTTGAVRALNNIGYNMANASSDVIPIVSTDGSAEWGDELLKNRQILGTALQDPNMMAEYVANIMKNLLDGKEPLEDTGYVFDNSIDASTDGVYIVKNKIVRMPYTEYKPNF